MITRQSMVELALGRELTERENTFVMETKSKYLASLISGDRVRVEPIQHMLFSYGLTSDMSNFAGSLVTISSAPYGRIGTHPSEGGRYRDCHFFIKEDSDCYTWFSNIIQLPDLNDIEIGWNTKIFSINSVLRKIIDGDFKIEIDGELST